MSATSASDDPPHDPLLEKVPVVEGYKVLGKVVLLQRVGAGGMGIVYRGWHLTFRVEVAVKVLKPSLATDPEYVVRFRREAEMALKITHQNVVRVYDVGEQHGLHYIVMEFVRGETLRRRVRRWGRMRQAEAVSLLTAVAAGLAEAHSHGIVHRDIKPENILLSRQGRVKLADLGLVRQVYGSDGKSLAGGSSMILGTPQYMSPEQWDTPDVRPSADVWALGAVLYYLLTGEHGIPQMPMLKMGRWVQENPFPTLRVMQDLHADLHRIFERCVERDPKARYQDAGELQQDLSALRLHDDSLLKESAHRSTGPEAVEDWSVPSAQEIEAIEARLTNPHAGLFVTPRGARARARYRRTAKGHVAWAVFAGMLVAALLLLRGAAFGDGVQDRPLDPGPRAPERESKPDRQADFARVWRQYVRCEPPIELTGEVIVPETLRVYFSGAPTYVTSYTVILDPMAPAAHDVFGDSCSVQPRGRSKEFRMTAGRYRMRLQAHADQPGVEVEGPVIVFGSGSRGRSEAADASGKRPANGADGKPPKLLWLTPEIGETLAVSEDRAAVPVAVQVTFANGSGSVQIDGQPAQRRESGRGVVFDRKVDLSKGPRAITVVAVDDAGRTTRITSLPIGGPIHELPIELAGIVLMPIPVKGRLQWKGEIFDITVPYWVAATETSAKQWKECGMPVPEGLADDMPVTDVSAADIDVFLRTLNERAAAEGRLPRRYRYRLLDELLWEYARRADPKGAAAPVTIQVLGGGPVAVASGEPNLWRLFHMDDNVSELCADDLFVRPVRPSNGVTSGDVLQIRAAGTGWRSVCGGAWTMLPGQIVDGMVDRLAERDGRRKSVGFRVGLVRDEQ